jgi:hypothetical protein
VDELNGSAVLQDKISTAKSPVSKALACQPVEKAAKNQLRLYSQRLPALAFYREGGNMDPDMRVNSFGDSGRFRFQWLTKIPGDRGGFDGKAVARTWCYDVWYEACKAIRSSTFQTTTAADAAIINAKPGKYEIMVWPAADVAMVSGVFTIEHTAPPIDQDELDDLKTIALELELYDESGVTTGYEMGPVEQAL